MRVRTLIAGLLASGAAALAAAPAQAQAPAAPPACPASFSVLHDDRIGSLILPAGSYTLTVLDPATLSCAAAAAAFRRFLEDFDGKLPSPWRLDAASATFSGPAGAGFTVAPATTPSGGGGGTHPATGLACPGTFRVLHNDRIGRLRLPAGRYRVTLGATAPVSCPGSSRALARFLARPSGRLPRGWRLVPATGTFMRNGVVAFRIKPAVPAR